MVLKKYGTAALVIAAIASTAAVAGEPEGFRPGLYLGEVGAAFAFSAPPIIAGYYLLQASDDNGAHGDVVHTDMPLFILGGSLALGYPFVASFGTNLIGENLGAPSSNKGSAYFWPSLVGMPISIGAAFLSPHWFPHSDDLKGFAAGAFISAVPNAFLNAVVYNWVKEPRLSGSSAPFNVEPYLASYRGDGGARPTPVYGVALSF